ncbi:MAG: hypothetical protein A2163_09670 [Actinobacteria bacterium RBG_13_35_12]|nr:MAG: hypothetical protein A2163_09670 [Actinobacteria bacterium RBG_13_35_12]
MEKWTDEQGTIHYYKNRSKSDFSFKDDNYNTSFEELNNKISNIISKKDNSFKFFNYLNPLHTGMTMDEVLKVWPKDTKAGGYEKNGQTLEAHNYLYYNIGVTLYFKNGKLRSWKLKE